MDKRKKGGGKVWMRWMGLCLLIPAWILAQPGRKQVLEGNRAYAEEKYDAAATAYQDALLEAPTSPIIHYNLGNASYKKNDPERALESYEKALTFQDPLLLSRVHYNRGNAFYRLGRLQEAIQAYEEALKLNPDDEDAKYNLEFVRNKLKQNAQPQAGQSQPQSKESQEKQEPQPQEGQDQKPQSQSQQGEQQTTTGQNQEPPPTGLSKEEAERILNAIQENQDKVEKEKARAVTGRAHVEKDW